MPHVISRLHMTRFNRVPLVFGLALQLIQGMLAAGEIIPAERRINWDPGIPGGIPNRTNIFANVKNAPYNAKGDGLADDTSAIQSAISACPSNQVVFIPAGTYKITTSLRINGAKTLRGAGPDQTTLTYLGPLASHIIGIRDNTLLGLTIAIAGGFSKGSTNITLADASGFSVGNMVLLDQLNDGVFVNPNGLQGCTYCSRDNGARALGQIVEVKSTNGNQITFSPPFYWTYTNTLAPQATRLDFTTRWTGLEDFKIINASAAADYSLMLESAGYCWIRNVESAKCNRRHVWTYYAMRCEIRDCYFHDGQRDYGPDHAYGVLVGNHSTANLVENNIFASLHVPMQNDSGSSGNVWSYNYVTNVLYNDPEWLQPDASTHGAHPMMNLWEGNLLYKIYTDWLHGSASHNTYFRNFASGWQKGNIYGNNAFGAEKQNTYMNLLGNVFGTAGKSDTYELFRTVRKNSEITIYELGYTSIGDGGPIGDANVKTTLLRHGNYDYVTKKTNWDSTIGDHELPSSYYLTAKPLWWGNLPWPPVGPDLNPKVATLPAQSRFNSLQAATSRRASSPKLRVIAP